MNLRKFITVGLLSLLCTTTCSTVAVKAETDNTVISNQETQEEGISNNQELIWITGEEDLLSVVTRPAIQEVGVLVTQGAIEVVTPMAITQEIVEKPVISKTEEVATQLSNKVQKKKEKKYTKAELRLLSCLIYCEANGEPYAGKLAVGIVVMNRKSSNSFPDTVKGVIYQKYQFGPARNGALKRALKEYDSGRFTSATEKQCIKAAKAALNGKKTVTYRSKKYNMDDYYFFSTYVKGKRLTIKNHQFK